MTRSRDWFFTSVELFKQYEQQNEGVIYTLLLELPSELYDNGGTLRLLKASVLPASYMLPTPGAHEEIQSYYISTTPSTGLPDLESIEDV